VVFHSRTRVRRIIRTAPLGLGLAVACACTFNPQSTSTASAPRVQVTQVPKTPNAPGNAVWVLTPVGVNVRATPELSAARLATLAQGARLDISETHKAGSNSWLHVKSQSGQAEGWVLDTPELVIHREVALHAEQVGGYSNLFPAEWQLNSGNPATMTAPQGDDQGAALLIQTAGDLPQLPPTPTQPGQELRQEGPFDVYGKPVFVTIYKLNGGGYEFAVKTKCKVSAYLLDYRQGNRNQPDPGLFRTLMSSVIAPDCAPGA
jgi:Bacterial SH3 domain